MKTFREFRESSIYDFLIWEPTGRLKEIADSIDTLSSKKSELYRGISAKELKSINKDGYAVSKGKGNTRNVVASYLADDIKLAGRFALVDFRDKKNGFILVLDRKKLPELTARDPGNYTTSVINKEAIIKVIDLSKL